MWVLVDGHNALSALGIRGRTHEEARGALLRRVAATTGSAIVFFDARNAPRDLPSSNREHGVHVRYCRTREADAAIIDAVRNSSEPNALIVVTNDREVAGRCAQLGAQALSVQDFFRRPGRTREPKQNEAQEPKRRIPKGRIHYTPEDFDLPDFIDLENPNLKEEDDD